MSRCPRLCDHSLNVDRKADRLRPQQDAFVAVVGGHRFLETPAQGFSHLLGRLPAHLHPAQPHPRGHRAGRPPVAEIRQRQQRGGDDGEDEKNAKEFAHGLV